MPFYIFIHIIWIGLYIQNISVTALDQSVRLAPIIPNSNNQYKLSSDFLHDMDNNISQIDSNSISVGGPIAGNSIIWTLNGSPLASPEFSSNYRAIA